MEIKRLQMNKRGNINLIIIFFFLMFLVLLIGFVMVVGSAITNYVWDEAVPELTGLGTVDNANFTEYAGYTITPANNIVQSFTWVTGVLYLMMLIGIIGVVVVAREGASKWLIGFFLLCTILLIMGSILMSNIYEEFYDGSDDLATRLQEHTLLSWMILYSPMIFTVICFIAGIILFTGVASEEEFV